MTHTPDAIDIMNAQHDKIAELSARRDEMRDALQRLFSSQAIIRALARGERDFEAAQAITQCYDALRRALPLDQYDEIEETRLIALRRP